ncbi:MAG: methylation-associated defense system protein MAD4 [Planctomycetota bacterium]
MSKRDLFVVVADLDAENVMKALLSRRQEALGVSLQFNPDRPPQGDLLRYQGRDSGCYRKAVDLLRPPQRTHRHAILCFDHHGSGAERQAAEQTEADLERQLHASGWQHGSVAVIVIEPELESWVWANSPQVADALGWRHEDGELRTFLQSQGFWEPRVAKPSDPKAAMDAALRQKNQPGGRASIFSRLASKVSVRGCEDRAFIKLADTLRRWFPA